MFIERTVVCINLMRILCCFVRNVKQKRSFNDSSFVLFFFFLLCVFENIICVFALWNNAICGAIAATRVLVQNNIICIKSSARRNEQWQQWDCWRWRRPNWTNKSEIIAFCRVKFVIHVGKTTHRQTTAEADTAKSFKKCAKTSKCRNPFPDLSLFYNAHSFPLVDAVCTVHFIRYCWNFRSFPLLFLLKTSHARTTTIDIVSSCSLLLLPTRVIILLKRCRLLLCFVSECGIFAHLQIKVVVEKQASKQTDISSHCDLNEIV